VGVACAKCMMPGTTDTPVSVMPRYKPQVLMNHDIQEPPLGVSLEFMQHSQKEHKWGLKHIWKTASIYCRSVSSILTTIYYLCK
jgi:hypothetical protein